LKHLFRASSIVFVLVLVLIPRVSATAPGTYVELYWPFDKNYNFDIDLKVTDTPELDTGLFWSHQFAFVGGSGGYLGLQIVGSTKKAIFSIWNALAGSSECQVFTHEGSGWMCLIDYDWKVGFNYRLRLWVLNKDPAGNEWWLGTINDYSINSDTVIGRILVPSSFGWLSSWSVTWIEYFVYSTCDVPYTRAIFSYPFARNGAGDHAPEKAKATYGTSSCQNSNVKYIGDGAYAIEAGKDVRRITPDQTWLWTQEPTLVQQPIPEFPASSVIFIFAIMSVISALGYLRKREDGLYHC